MSDKECMIMETPKKKKRAYVHTEEFIQEKIERWVEDLTKKWESYKNDLLGKEKLSCNYVFYEGLCRKS